jgi:hypothetical protein
MLTCLLVSACYGAVRVTGLEAGVDVGGMETGAPDSRADSAVDAGGRPDGDAPEDGAEDASLDARRDDGSEDGGEPDAEVICVGNGHDEDLDGVDDDCDNCPTRPNPLQQNEDLDELGDACEATSILGSACVESLVFFDPFIEGPGPWTTMGGAWVFGADEVVASAEGSTGAAVLGVSLAPTFVVEGTFRLEAPSYPGPAYAGVLFGAQRDEVGRVSYSACLYEQRSRTLGLWRVDAGSEPSLLGSDPTTHPGLAGIFQVRAFARGGTVVCRVFNEGGAVGETSADDVDLPPPYREGEVGLAVQNIQASFGSFAAYQ